MTNRAVIVDGASGFAGSNFVHLLLRRGANVVALHRGAPERTLAAIRSAEVADHFCGDLPTEGMQLHDYTLTEAGLGVGDLAGRLDPDLPWEYWHLAANLQFMAGDATALRRVNVGGTRNVLDWFSSNFVGRPVVHVSTIYACGIADGVTHEQWHARPAGFRNHYEASKWAAEEVVRERLGRDLPGGVVRLPGLVGSSLTGRSRTRTGVYGLIERLVRLSNAAPDETIRVPVAPQAGEVLLPVDVGSHWLADLPIGDLVVLPQPIVHVVPEHVTPVSVFLAAINEWLPITLVPTPPNRAIPDPTHLEAVTYAGLGFVSDYLQAPRTRFDRSTLSSLGAYATTPIDAAAASMLVRSFVDHLRTVRSSGAPRGRRAATDGSSLTMLAPPGLVPDSTPITERGGSPCPR